MLILQPPDPLPVLDLPALPVPDVQAQYDDTYELLESVKDVSEKEVEDVLESTTDHIATLPSEFLSPLNTVRG